MNVRLRLVLCALPFLILGCDNKPAPTAAAPAAAPAAAAPAAAAAAPAAEPAAAVPVAAKAAEPAATVAGEHGEGCAEHADQAGEPAAAPVETGCADHEGKALEHPEVVTVTRPDGATGTHAGHPFAADVATVKVSALLADPKAYAGKTVALEGDVSAMCQHKRAWFAIAAEDQSGNFVRVMAAPTFLVPEGSVGKATRAEGVVEVVEVAAEHARHMADEHKLGDPEAITANVQQVVVRARGADFF